jgi:Ssp1 endopeptidase immunity protein Rap1a
MTRYAVAILLALTMPASAADTDSANYFLPGCKGILDRKAPSDPSEAMRQGLCVGLVVGLVYGAGGNHFCQPNGATSDQVVAVVVKYIEARPERMHERFGDLALEALEEAWPCKR